MEGNITIDNLKLAAYIDHLHIFAPLIAPLDHISTKMENAAVD